MGYYKATIEILIWVDDEGEACDCISETMRPLLREFAGPESSVIDWRYAENGGPEPDSGVGFEYSMESA